MKYLDRLRAAPIQALLKFIRKETGSGPGRINLSGGVVMLVYLLSQSSSKIEIQIKQIVIRLIHRPIPESNFASSSIFGVVVLASYFLASIILVSLVSAILVPPSPPS